MSAETLTIGLVIPRGSYSPPIYIVFNAAGFAENLLLIVFGLTRPGIYLSSIFSTDSEIVYRLLTVSLHMMHHRGKYFVKSHYIIEFCYNVKRVVFQPHSTKHRYTTIISDL